MFSSNKKTPDVAAASADVTMFEEEFNKPPNADNEYNLAAAKKSGELAQALNGNADDEEDDIEMATAARRRGTKKRKLKRDSSVEEDAERESAFAEEKK